jgi:mono/diheme cytochrome c family protein
MSTAACKPMVIIAVLIATPLVVSCGQDRDAATTSVNAAKQKDMPPAVRYEDHIFADGVPPPGGQLSNPQPATSQNAKDGEALFNSMNCDGCHGGDAGGAVGPSLADGRWRYGGRDEEIFNSIFYGRPKGMPAYGGLIGQGGVWLLVTYLKSLPKPDSVPTLSAVAEQGAAGSPGHSGTTGVSTQ